MTASESVDRTKRYPGTLSRTAGRAVNPLIDSSAAPTNAVAPKSATGMPRTVLKPAQIHLGAADGLVDVAETAVRRIVKQVVVRVGRRGRRSQPDDANSRRAKSGRTSTHGTYEL